MAKIKYNHKTPNRPTDLIKTKPKNKIQIKQYNTRYRQNTTLPNVRKKKSLNHNSEKSQITLKPLVHHDQPLDPVTTGPPAQRTEGGVAEQQLATATRKARCTQKHSGTQTGGRMAASHAARARLTVGLRYFSLFLSLKCCF